MGYTCPSFFHRYQTLTLVPFFVSVLVGCQVKDYTTGEQVLSENWVIASSANVSENIQELTENAPDPTVWTKAKVPTTVLGALVEAGVYKDPFMGKNLEAIPRAPFEKPWWFRNTFTLDEIQPDAEVLRLLVDGINYRADIWLNGKKIANQDTIFGAFRQFDLDITQAAQSGANTLLVKVFPPQVRDFYMGFVDWAPTPPDHYMGIFREIRLRRSGKVTLDMPFVAPDLKPGTLDKATLTISTEITNHSNQAKTVRVTGFIESVRFEKEVSLEPQEHKTIYFTPKKFPQLTIKNPRLWWPNGLGSPEMYDLRLELHEKQNRIDEQSTSFGIREVETYLTQEGVRGYRINGRPLLIKGAGWVDDLFLRYQPKKDSAQIRYVKEMNLNALRFEGVWGNNQHIYDLCDRNGILLMVGWSCQWEWPDYLGLPLNMKPGDENLPINEGVDLYAVKLTPNEETLLSDYFRDQVKWLRNHPSIFTWAGGSDAMPTPALEKRYRQILADYDQTRPFLVSTGAFESTVSGPSGMKMNGPYEYVPPVYWYEDKKLGGAFGFNSEVGPGPQIPPASSIRKMIPDARLWPADNDVWNYHSGRKDFNTLGVYLTALNKRYGTPKDLDELTLKAQIMNYEAIRPMFEAHVVNHAKSTGVIQWMLNSPWPEFYWQLFDYYLMPTGAYYGAKKACAPLSIIYNYRDNLIYFGNDTQEDANEMTAEVKLLDSNSKVIQEFTKTYDLPNNGISRNSNLKLPTTSEVYFLDLKLKDKNGKLVADNFYWLASKPDQLDWGRYYWYYTPQKQFADFTSLNRLAPAQVAAKMTTREINGEFEVSVNISNPIEKIAFFIELELQDGITNEAITPVFWSDNYVSLLPGENKVLTVRCRKNGKKAPKVTLRGVNVAKQTIQ